MASKPIKTDLFRFVTVRTPQLINEQRKDLGFIFHPNPSQSVFLEEIGEGTDINQARTFVRDAVNDFTNPLKTYLKTKEVDKDLYNFSSWLMNNRSNFTKAEVVVEMGSLTPLVDAKVNELWDNLYYQVLTRKSSYVRQACIQLIIANNFIAKYTTYDATVHEGTEEEFLVRLANAKVVIDKSFTTEEDNSVSSKGNYEATNKELVRAANEHFIGEEVSALKVAATELKDVDYSYQKAYKKSYESAKASYEKVIAPLIEVAERNQEELQKKEDDLAVIEKREPREIPLEVDLPKFDFTFEKPLTEAYLKNISDDTRNVIKELKLEERETVEEASILVDAKLKEANRELFSNIKTTNKSLIINGVTVRPEIGQELSPYCFLVNTIVKRKGFIVPPSTNVLFTINLGNTGVYIVSQNHTLVHGATTITSTESLGFSQIGGGVKLRLFNDKTFFITEPYYDLSGEFTLSNGDKVTYSVRVYISKVYTKGCGKLITNNPVLPVDIELYGVNKVGIADFRKVEQEVCCYVPGQVSHIENILAREYKERSTRNLTSIERTTETTSEKEVENLTDSSTTERNEMQTEVSSVLNEDKSTAFGASAGVNGKFPSGTYHAEGYADFANSSSSSQSNSNAQTYAQEVTERTLERIVQKTTKKRTSRILKEFEENNKHGFDNREGEQHVSGVYRWIDVIYKNQLVNYGKRLMYEFMVPEPSKFFKEAIINKEEESENIFLIEEPKTPESLGLSSAADITESEYQNFAAAYGAEVGAVPELYSYAGTSFTKSQQAGDGSNKTNKAPSDTVKVTKGYKAIEAKTSGVSGSGWTYVTVGGINMNINQDIFIPIGSHYNEEVPVSAYFEWNWIVNVNIVIKCVRTEEYFQQWQNETYKAIVDAYNERLQEYRDAKLAAGIGENQEEEKIRFNPLFNRAIEKRELKRICIEMLAKPYGNPLGKDNYGIGGSDVPYVKQTVEFENHAAHVKFFEQAFDWEIMAYLFYPYYWAKQGNWKDLIQQNDAADPIFQAFLQSGMSRAVIPVRPGFEDAVVYYMETGDIWNGGDLVLDNEDDLYISIAEEMQVVEGSVEDEWETRMPTSLTMIQKDTVGLNETGLPCCDFVLNNESGDDFTNPITPETALVGGPKTTTADPALIK